MQNLIGKRLLILGGRPAASLDIVKIAKRMGVYTIVTDNLNPERSPAKKIADEYWNISTADVSRLAAEVSEKRIDGVFTGAHEFNLLRTKELCQACKLPFYATDEQLQLNFDKSYFKQKCSEFGIFVPESYDYSESGKISAMKFPVIVKPRDGGGGQGITVCNTKESLPQAIKFAYQHSPSKQAVVEEYVLGCEITAVYTMKNGEISLSCFRDRYPTEEFKQVTAQYDLSLIPSRYTEQFIRVDHPKFVRLLKSVGAKDGCVFFQGIANKEKITFFECGYRLNALCDYHNIEKLNGINYLEMMISYALTGEMLPYDLSMDNPQPKHVSGIFNITAHAGVIGYQSGIEQARRLKNVISADYLHVVGDEIIENTGLAQSVFRAHIYGKDLSELAETISAVQHCIVIQNTEGKNMQYKPFNTLRCTGKP